MYLYNASALALAGEIRRPFQRIIDTQASACLAMIGGISNAEVDNFEVKGIASFRRAYATTSGSFDPKNQTHNTSVRVVVEGLNVLDVISADRVIALLSSQYSPTDSEPRILTTGSRFENLRLSGEPIETEFETNLLEECDTFAKFARAYSHDLFGKGPGRQEPEGKGFYRVSLVKKVSSRFPLRTKRGGLAIEIANFGRIHLAELFIEHSRRQLNMLRLDLGSPVAGNLLIASASCNGLGGDPGTDDD
jgi:hypothetical protein